MKYIFILILITCSLQVINAQTGGFCQVNVTPNSSDITKGCTRAYSTYWGKYYVLHESAWVSEDSILVASKFIRIKNQPILIPAISGMTQKEVDITIVGAQIGNTVAINPLSDIRNDNIRIDYVYVVSADVIRVVFGGVTVGTNGNVTRNFDIKVDKN